MKLLIVEDNSFLAEITAELLRSLDQSAHQFEAITVAEDLRTAILCLPEHDVVLCDGMFPVSPESRHVVEDWDVVCHEARRRRIHFVLYSGSVRALDSARESNTPAIAKPASIEEIYAALTHPRLLTQSNGAYGKSPVMAETQSIARGKHVQNL
jgi:CheY-like chemotaxis protein